jgi:hypothetical protein
MNIYNKYLKYKNKYLQLKNQIAGDLFLDCSNDIFFNNNHETCWVATSSTKLDISL